MLPNLHWRVGTSGSWYSTSSNQSIRPASTGSVNCGLFAIAFAYELVCAVGKQPVHDVRFDQKRMRSHLSFSPVLGIENWPTSPKHVENRPANATQQRQNRDFMRTAGRVWQYDSCDTGTTGAVGAAVSLPYMLTREREGCRVPYAYLKSWCLYKSWWWIYSITLDNWRSTDCVRGHSQRMSEPRGGGGFGKSGQTRT
jgi:hypothetical protein